VLRSNRSLSLPTIFSCQRAKGLRLLCLRDVKLPGVPVSGSRESMTATVSPFSWFSFILPLQTSLTLHQCFFVEPIWKHQETLPYSLCLSRVSCAFLFKRKVGAAVIAVRRAGSTHVLSSMNYFFLINQMIVPGSSYWNMGIGRNPGEVKNDAEGIQTMKTLGKNMAWLLKRISR